MAGKQYGAVLPSDVANPIDEYREKREEDGDDVSQADAVRHFLRKGIEYKRREQDTQDTSDQRIDPSEFALDTARIILAGAIIVAVGGLTSGVLNVTDVVLTAGTLALIGSFVVVVVNRSRLPTPRVADDASSTGGVKHEH